jgi:hypothetical protein
VSDAFPTLDVTALLAENHRRAVAMGRKQLLVLISAQNCPGCDVLDQQLHRADVRHRLGGAVYVEKIDAGDFLGDAARRIRVGAWTLESPGFPTAWLWALEPDGLAFVALQLGPLDARDPAAALDALLRGESQVVEEARGVRALACCGALCLPLDSGNGFRAALSIRIPGQST